MFLSLALSQMWLSNCYDTFHLNAYLTTIKTAPAKYLYRSVLRTKLRDGFVAVVAHCDEDKMRMKPRRSPMFLLLKDSQVNKFIAEP